MKYIPFRNFIVHNKVKTTGFSRLRSGSETFQSRLRYEHELIEEIMERFYEMGMRLEEHPILKIDAEIVSGVVH